MYQTILNYQKEIQKEIEELNKSIINTPNEQLLCCHDRQYTKWYVKKNGGEREYLPKTQHNYACMLAKRKYAEEKIHILKKELFAVKLYIKYHKDVTSVMEKYLGKEPPYRNLLEDEYKTIDEKIQIWMNEEYEKSEKYLEQLKRDADGEYTYRSKSEMIIEMALKNEKIPYRYECVVSLNGVTVAPDFTIMHPVTGKIMYLEHFGMMDDPQYINAYKRKLGLYASAGIYLGETLFATYETSASQLMIEDVNAVIKRIRMTV